MHKKKLNPADPEFWGKSKTRNDFVRITKDDLHKFKLVKPSDFVQKIIAYIESLRKRYPNG